MKRTTALLFLILFSGLCLYFYFAEDFCPLHSAPQAGSSFSHLHHTPPAVCLCFWGTLFGPRTFDFCCYQSAERLLGRSWDPSMLRTFSADIAHPPKILPS